MELLEMRADFTNDITLMIYSLDFTHDTIKSQRKSKHVF